jgi:hypothetical protein
MSKNTGKKDCNCGCGGCKTKSIGPILRENKVFNTPLSNDLKFHIDNNIPLNETKHRVGSKKFKKLINEASALYSRFILDLNKKDEKIIKEGVGFGNKMGGNNFTPQKEIPRDRSRKDNVGRLKPNMSTPGIKSLSENEKLIQSCYIKEDKDYYEKAKDLEGKKQSIIDQLEKLLDSLTPPTSDNLEARQGLKAALKSNNVVMMKKALDHWREKLDPRSSFTDDDWENFYADYDLPEGIIKEIDDTGAKRYFLKKFMDGEIEKLPDNPLAAYTQLKLKGEVNEAEEDEKKGKKVNVDGEPFKKHNIKNLQEMDPVKWDLQNGISAQWAPDKVGHTADGDITDDPGDGYDTSNKDTINEKLVQSCYKK